MSLSIMISLKGAHRKFGIVSKVEMRLYHTFKDQKHTDIHEQ